MFDGLAGLYLRDQQRCGAHGVEHVANPGEVGGGSHDRLRLRRPGSGACYSIRVGEMMPRIGAHEHVVFGGRVPTDPRNIVERAMARETPPELKDRRDWQAITAWADAVAEMLSRRERASQTA